MGFVGAFVAMLQQFFVDGPEKKNTVNILRTLTDLLCEYIGRAILHTSLGSKPLNTLRRKQPKCRKIVRRIPNSLKNTERRRKSRKNKNQFSKSK